ncbi:hypothetical protein TW95_gp0671 [Pandoravirus inopinatum]|uniref:Uncharacterized protein n=1 Tax=Pandoravirus inopinatum TaxID=1605721 RepID=A0A0B5J6L4_9VIRU|nr:hypothetical protein TW95_gp0671 [Pandoravirus inopinatum]AJF97405.1 hypothetical protein [Pandoravirus inopinatum]
MRSVASTSPFRRPARACAVLGVTGYVTGPPAHIPTRLFARVTPAQRPPRLRTSRTPHKKTAIRSSHPNPKIARTYLVAVSTGAAAGGIVGIMGGIQERPNQGPTLFQMYYCTTVGAGCFGLPVAAAGCVATWGALGVPGALACAFVAAGFCRLASMGWQPIARRPPWWHDFAWVENMK